MAGSFFISSVRTTSRFSNSWTARFVNRVARRQAVLSDSRNAGQSHETGPATGIVIARRTYRSLQHAGHSGSSVFGCRCQPVGSLSLFPGFGSIAFLHPEQIMVVSIKNSHFHARPCGAKRRKSGCYFSELETRTISM
jgi:hypothetical protein